MAKAFLRPLLIAVAAAALAACAATTTDGPAATDAAATAPSATAATSTAAASPKPAEEPAAPEEPMTRSRASAECWMRLEKARVSGDIDVRATYVEKCIAGKLKTSDAKPDEKKTERAQAAPQPRPKPAQ